MPTAPKIALARAKLKTADRHAPGRTSKLDRLVEMLRRPDGASIAELGLAVGWQAHSVRGALAGALKKKGHLIVSEKRDGARRYRIETSQ